MISVKGFVEIKKSEGYKEIRSDVGFTSLGMKVGDWFYTFHINHDSKDVEYRVEYPSRDGIDTKGFIIYNLNRVLVTNGMFFREGE